MRSWVRPPRGGAAVVADLSFPPFFNEVMVPPLGVAFPENCVSWLRLRDSAGALRLWCDGEGTFLLLFDLPLVLGFFDSRITVRSFSRG